MNRLIAFSKKHRYVLISLLLHIVVLLAATLGWSFARKPDIETLVVTVDLLPVSNISNVKTKKAQKEKVVKAKKAKKTQKSIKPTKSAPPPVEKKAKPVKPKKDVKTSKKETKSEKAKPKSKIAAPKKKDAKQPVKDKKAKEKPKAKEKKAKPTPKPKKKPKEVKKKPKPKKKENKPAPKKTKDLDALLRTLEQSSEGDNPKSSQYKREQKNDIEHDAFGSLQEDLPLSISEKNMIKEQIRRQWNTSMVAGVRNADKIIVTLALKFEIDGVVRAVDIISMQCPGIDRTTCQAVADSALRATHLASPLDGLPPERYDIWKEINFAFTPVD